jgi:hypothetical protein
MRRLWGGALALAFVITACSRAEPGAPVAGPTRAPGPGPSTEAEPTATATTTARPSPTTGSPRPRPLDLAAVDPCALLRDIRPNDYGIDMVGPGTGGSSSVFPGARDCFASGVRANMGVDLIPVLDEGFEDYVGAVRASTSRSAVAGYPFALLRPSDPGACFGVLDVHDNQLLYLSVSTGVGEPPAPQDTMCGLLPKLAGAAVNALRR